MIRIASRLLVSLGVIGLGLLGITGTSTPPRKPAPTGEFLKFGAEPASVCINIGVPVVRVSFTALSSNHQCVIIKVNGQTLVSAFESPEPGISGQNRCGEGEWGETYGFSLNTLFGNSIPPSITINGELETGGPVTSTQTILDTAQTTITSTTCGPPSITPGG